MTFSKFDEHSSPIFKSLKIIKLCDLVTLHIAIFMFKFHHQMLPPAFELYFTPVENVNNYNTRSLATQTYYLPKIRTNYGKFNVRFQGPIVWNAIGFHVKSLSFKKFQKYFKQDLKVNVNLVKITKKLQHMFICIIYVVCLCVCIQYNNCNFCYKFVCVLYVI